MLVWTVYTKPGYVDWASSTTAHLCDGVLTGWQVAVGILSSAQVVAYTGEGGAHQRCQRHLRPLRVIGQHHAPKPQCLQSTAPGGAYCQAVRLRETHATLHVMPVLFCYHTRLEQGAAVRCVEELQSA